MERSQSRRKGWLTKTRWLAWLLPALFSACVSAQLPQAQTPPRLPRATPSYVQWLERQSLRVAAQEYTQVVSGTSLQWRAPSVDTASGGGTASDRVHTLLDAADTWLYIDPASLLLPSTTSVWQALRQAVPLLAPVGIRGLYVAPTAELADIWHKNAPAATTDSGTTPAISGQRMEQSLNGGNGAPVALQHAHYMGTDKDFAALSVQATQAQWQLGADILPLATGIGPDFMLAAQGVRDYPGLYMMLEVPAPLWDSLPPAESWQGVPLSDSQCALLARESVIPPVLARQELGLPYSGGWAVTGQIRGNDGANHRMVYRYDTTPQRPLLNWDTPTGDARTVLMASIIKEVGVMQQALVGIHAAPALGLDALAHGQQPTLEPAPSMLRDLTREVRRYGGWSMQNNYLPQRMLPMQQRVGVDFCQDSVTTPLAAAALVTGQAQPLREALRQMMQAGVVFSRLVRHTPAGQTLPVPDATDATQGQAFATLAQTAQQKGWGHGATSKQQRLSAAALAAVSLGLTPQQASQGQHTAQIAQRHVLLTKVLAGLPGLFMLHDADLRGALVGASERACGVDLLHTGAIASRAGREGAECLYATLYGEAPRKADYEATQEAEARTTYLAELTRILRARRELGLGTWRVKSLPRCASESCFAVLLQQKNSGRNLLLAANFSSKAQTVKIDCSIESSMLRDVFGGDSVRATAGSVQLTLPAYTCQWLTTSAGE